MKKIDRNTFIKQSSLVGAASLNPFSFDLINRGEPDPPSSRKTDFRIMKLLLLQRTF